MKDIKVTILEKSDKGKLESSINFTLTLYKKAGHEIINIQYSSGNGKYSAMIMYQK